MTHYLKPHLTTPFYGQFVLPTAEAMGVACVSGIGFQRELRFFHNRTQMTADHDPGLYLSEAVFLRKSLQKGDVLKVKPLDVLSLPLNQKGAANSMNPMVSADVNFIALYKLNLRLSNFS